MSDPIRLIEGDCLPVMKSYPTGAFHAVITDPPYSERTHTGHDSGASRAAGDAGYDGSARKGLGYAAWTQKDVEVYVPEMCRVASGWWSS